MNAVSETKIIILDKANLEDNLGYQVLWDLAIQANLVIQIHLAIQTKADILDNQHKKEIRDNQEHNRVVKQTKGFLAVATKQAMIAYQV